MCSYQPDDSSEGDSEEGEEKKKNIRSFKGPQTCKPTETTPSGTSPTSGDLENFRKTSTAFKSALKEWKFSHFYTTCTKPELDISRALTDLDKRLDAAVGYLQTNGGLTREAATDVDLSQICLDAKTLSKLCSAVKSAGPDAAVYDSMPQAVNCLASLDASNSMGTQVGLFNLLQPNHSMLKERQ